MVATPIGNLGDITFRAVETLKTVDLVLAEDTRQFAKLAQHFEISTPCKSYYDERERELAPRYVDELKQGKNIALVSDSGTPLLSDPGYHLVCLAVANDIVVSPLPGASALLAALTVSGLEVERFVFEGFLPMKPGRRRKVLEEALQRALATVIYESPHRIVRLVEELAEIAPDRELSVSRELTKLHEETIRGTSVEVLEVLKSKPAIKGEFVLVIRGKRES